MSVHHVHGPTVIAGCCNVIIVDGTPVAAVLAGEAIANRIDELLATHGLADIPDTAAALTPPLPAEPDYCRNCGGRNDHHWAGCQST